MYIFYLTKLKYFMQYKNPFIRNEKLNTRFQHSIHQFPALGNSLAPNQPVFLNYGQALQTETHIDVTKTKSETCPDGWVVLSNQSQKKEKKEETDYESVMDNIQDALTTLYIQRKIEKLEIWGDELYERHYHFPNYDYNYFSTLDDNTDSNDNYNDDYDNDLDDF